MKDVRGTWITPPPGTQAAVSRSHNMVHLRTLGDTAPRCGRDGTWREADAAGTWTIYGCCECWGLPDLAERLRLARWTRSPDN